MQNLSPGFQARFAKIELEKPSKRDARTLVHSRKQLQQVPVSQNQPPVSVKAPSRAPQLSTAARAESRSTCLPRPTEPAQTPHKRNLHSAQSPEASSPRRMGLRDEKHTKYHDGSNLSFMRPTSSSRKKQTAAPQPEKTSAQPRPPQQDLYTRKNYYASISAKKRQLPKASKPADITNKFFDPPPEAPFGCQETIFTSYSPSRVRSGSNLASNAGEPSTNATHKPLRAADEPKMYNSSKSPSTGQVGRQPSHLPIRKPVRVEDMYGAIYQAGPSFFYESNSLSSSLIQNPPINAADLINGRDGPQLSVYERGEIMRCSDLYYIPQMGSSDFRNTVSVSNFKNNYGFDDADGNYISRPRDHIEYRYEIMSILGTGSFGNVLLCKDHKYSSSGQNRLVAIKLIKNELDWSLQAISEIKMLKHLMAASRGTPNDYIMNYCDHFHFRGHMCIASEVLSLNLYTFLEIQNFSGISLDLIRHFAHKILKGLEFIHSHKVIHCDIKPENIMIKLPSHYKPGDENVPGFDVKLIDFGSSCFNAESSFSYIQSRFYRAPEVILGARYSYGIDIWSFGCVIAELFTGSPLLPGKNEIEQIALVLELFGPPASSCILSERKKLVQSMRGEAHKKFHDSLSSSDAPTFRGKVSNNVDEKKLKKTLLYTLFNLEGKINLPFLNLQLQSMEAKSGHSTAAGPFKRNVKLSSRSLEVALRLHSSGEERNDSVMFLKFISSILRWDSKERASASQLLKNPFLQGLA